jgi:hypothetical protein
MKTHWGRWILDMQDYSLSLREDESFSYYCIPLSLCNSSAEILDWIVQVQEKTWTFQRDVGDLAEALNDLLDLQRNFCGRAERSDGRTDYAAKILRERLERYFPQDNKEELEEND